MSDESIDNDDLVNEAIALYLEFEDRGEAFDQEHWLEQFAPVRAQLEQFLNDQKFAQAELNQRIGKDESGATTWLMETEEPTASVGGSGTKPSTRTKSRVNTQATYEPGQRIANITLQRKLGAGGMGEVFEGVDETGRPVAIKLLSPRLSHSEESRKRFRQEGAIASSIVHPRCVFVRTVDLDGETPFIVMELMSGKTLKDVVQTDGALEPQRAIRLIDDAAQGLREAHEHGMIHRDVKPANCYIDEHDRVKIGDFGLARSMSERSDLTKTGNFVGTPLFASPEQVRGEKLDERSDVYSLAATLYYLVTGQAPFGTGGGAVQIIARIVSETPPTPSQLGFDIPPDLERVIMCGLANNRADRFPSIERFQASLRPLVDSTAAVASIGRRTAAYFTDLGLFAILSVALFIMMPMTDTNQNGNWLHSIIVLFLFGGYFFFTELRFGGTIGKRLLGLRVVRCPSGHRSEWWRILLRTVVLVVFSGIVSDIFLCSVDLASRPLQLLAVQFTMYFGGALVLCSTLPFSNYRQLLHDHLSGTFVIQDPPQPLNAPWHSLVRNVSFKSENGQACPSRIGRYELQRTISETQELTVFAGVDPQLDRKVWLARAKSEESSPWISQLFKGDGPNRMTRLRLVETGTEQGLPWAAFIAVDGCPFEYAQVADSGFAWEATRQILEQWCQEWLQSQSDGTALTINSTDQLWLDRRGRLTVIDFPVACAKPNEVSHGEPNSALETKANSPLSPLEIASWLARQSLANIRSSSLDANERIDAVLPLHARRIIDRLTRVKNRYHKLDELVADLRETEQRSTRVALSHRLIQFAVASVTISLIYGASLSLIKVGKFSITHRTADQLLAGHLLEELATNSELREQWEKTLPDSESPPTSAELKLAGERYQAFFQPKLASIIEQANRFERLIYENQGLTKLMGATHEELLFEEDEHRPGMFTVKSPYLLRTADFRAEQLLAMVEEEPEPATKRFQDRPGHLIALVIAPALLLWVWDVLSRGGIPARLAGIRFVDSKGRPAGFGRFAIRAAILWLPPLLIALVITYIDVYHPSITILSSIAFAAYAVLPLIYFGLVVYTVRRGIHDRISGTYVVPR